MMQSLEFTCLVVLKEFSLKVVNYKFTYVAFFFVVWQGIHNPGQTQEKNGGRGFILSQPQSAVLPRSGTDSDGLEPAPCFVIQNCQTHYSLRCTM